jgi:hypothetical protein
MKIPKSIRDLYQELLPTYQRLEGAVNSLIINRKERRWHYEGRVKGAESFALKLETGRETSPHALEDFFACTIVVENHVRVAHADKFVSDLFTVHARRPKDPKITHLQPYSFDFDDLRLYVKWKDDQAQKPTGFNGILFEVQIKTFLQHAWGIATHDFVYKSDEVDWASSRIAYQVKAMLENAELSIGEARKLTDSTMLNRTDRRCSSLRTMIEQIQKRWEPAVLPKDLRRLAENIDGLCRALRLTPETLWAAVDEATAMGEGAKTLNLSPYAVVVASLIRKQGANLFEPLSQPECRDTIFVANEIELPTVAQAAMKRIIRI